MHNTLSLQDVIATSVLQLDEAAQRVLFMLSTFLAKPHSFSEEAALAVSDAPVGLLDELMDAGLLESAGPERYTLHQTIVDYARTGQCNSVAYERMVEFNSWRCNFGTRCEREQCACSLRLRLNWVIWPV